MSTPSDTSRTTRRDILLTAAATLSAGLYGTSAKRPKLAVATYSLRKFSRPDAIRILKDLGVRHLSVKEFHLPYRSTDAELRAGREEFDAAGIEILSGGVVVTYKEKDDALRRYFEYGRTCRMPMLIMMPTAQQLPAIEALAKEFRIRVAVHNHGPEDKNFPTPESVYQAIRPLDPIVGVCIDIGHSARAGVDVVKAIHQCKDRLIDVHLKDLRNLTSHSDCEVGTGVLPVREILKALAAIKYAGGMSLEYEAEPENPMPGMKASLAYIRSALPELQG